MVSFAQNFLITLAASCVALAHVLPLVARDDGGLKLDFNVKNILKQHSNSTSNIKASDSDTVTANLKNYQVYYGVDIELGSNKQKVTVDIDTGSSDLWVDGANVQCNTSDGGDSCAQSGTYDPSQSSSSKDLGEAFQIGYGDGTSTNGEYYTDDIVIGGATVKNLQFAVASSTSVTQGGVFGIGFSSLEATSDQYPNLSYQLKSQGVILKNLYSLFLDSPSSSSGSIIFGGSDSSKYKGDLFTLPFQSSTRFTVNLDSIVPSGGSSIDASTQVLLDSGTTITLLPQSIVDSISQQFPNAQYNSDVGGYITDCSPPSGGLEYKFDGGSIQVPYSDLVTQAYDTNGNAINNVCTLNLAYSGDLAILGDNFLRRAYVIFDLDNKQAQLAQAAD